MTREGVVVTLVTANCGMQMLDSGRMLLFMSTVAAVPPPAPEP